MKHLEGEVVIVTGAGRGIGRAYADFFAGQGAKVVVNDNGGGPTGLGGDETPAAVATAAIIAAGGTAVEDTHDVATEAEAIVAAAIEAFGRVDAVVNNAGVVNTAAVEEADREQIARVLGVHLIGPLEMARAVWPHMRGRQHGRIVHTSSASVFGVGGAPLYPTAKAALIGLTRALAIDGAPFGIKVNCVMPLGYSRLAETQAGLGEFMKLHFSPQLIAPFVGSLIVRDTLCTGETFAVGGGRAARVFLGTVPGLVGFKTIQDCLDGFSQAMNRDDYVAPASMDEEMGYEFQQLGIDLAALGVDLSKLNTAT